MPKLQTQSYRDFSDGIVEKIDPVLINKGVPSFALNLFFHENIGNATVRSGTDLVGAQIENGKTCLGLHNFVKVDGTSKLIALFNNSAGTKSVLRLYAGSSWADASSNEELTADTKTRFFTYIDTVAALNGTDSPRSSTDGDAWVTSGGKLDVDNMPNGKFGIEWHDKIHIAGVSSNEDTVYISSLPDSSTNEISWTSGNDSIQIEPFEGQGAITGLGKVPGYLLVFKKYAMKRWNGSSTFPDDLKNIGTPSHESIVNTGQSCMFFSASAKDAVGFYETNGQSVNKISRPIKTIVDLISSTNYENVSGYGNREFAIWNVGDITYDGITYSNVCLYYHIDTQSWTVLSFPSNYHFFSRYISSDTPKLVAGDDDGQVIELFTGDYDNVTGISNIPINFALQSHIQEFGGRGKRKFIKNIMPHVRDGIGTDFMIRLDESDGGFESIGSINNKFENYIEKDLDFYTIEFRFNGSAGRGTEIIGYDIIIPEASDQ